MENQLDFMHGGCVICQAISSAPVPRGLMGCSCNNEAFVVSVTHVTRPPAVFQYQQYPDGDGERGLEWTLHPGDDERTGQCTIFGEQDHGVHLLLGPLSAVLQLQPGPG